MSTREPTKNLILPKRVGILGGGQLARLLALKGHQLGLEMHVLSQDPTDPAAQVVQHHRRGDLDSRTDLEKFLLGCDLVTFESEFLNAELLLDLRRKTGAVILPSPEHVHSLQDRLLQKQLLQKSRLPTAAFEPVSTSSELHQAFEKFAGRMVIKRRRFGYDGYGTTVISSKKELVQFEPTLEQDQVGFIAEAFVPFRKELAVILGRRSSGEIVALPYVETHQQDARCLWVKGPVSQPAALVNKLNALLRLLKRFVSELYYEGVLAFELFWTGRELLINELAPRVHNSGHYSLDALNEDQFTLHLKAILNLPFSAIQTKSPGFAMLNLLGSKHTPKKISWDLPANLNLHWYGKSASRPGRKMGHVNAIGSSPDSALKSLLRVRARFKL